MKTLTRTSILIVTSSCSLEWQSGVELEVAEKNSGYGLLFVRHSVRLSQSWERRHKNVTSMIFQKVRVKHQRVVWILLT